VVGKHISSDMASAAGGRKHLERNSFWSTARTAIKWSYLAEPTRQSLLMPMMTRYAPTAPASTVTTTRS
jgi:hypothetical protein